MAPADAMNLGNWSAPFAALVLVGCVIGPDDGTDRPPVVADASSDASSCTGASFDASDPRLPCDVEAVLAAKCQRCHNTDAVTDVCAEANACVAAPFTLLSWADTRQEYGGTPIYLRMPRAISSGFMPLMVTGLMPPIEPLTDTEKTLLLDWLGQCAPPADAVDCSHPDASGGSDAAP